VGLVNKTKELKVIDTLAVNSNRVTADRTDVFGIDRLSTFRIIRKSHRVGEWVV